MQIIGKIIIWIVSMPFVNARSLILFFHDTVNNIAKFPWLFRASADKPFFQYPDNAIRPIFKDAMSPTSL